MFIVVGKPMEKQELTTMTTPFILQTPVLRATTTRTAPITTTSLSQEEERQQQQQWQ